MDVAELRKNAIIWVTIAVIAYSVMSFSSNSGMMMTMVYAALIATISTMSLFVLECVVKRFDNMLGIKIPLNENYRNPSDYYVPADHGV